MNIADTALSLSIKMAPGPDHRQEPVAPDKNNENNVRVDASSELVVDIGTGIDIEISGSSAINSNNEVASVDCTSDLISQTTTNNGSDTKQEEPATVSTLNEGELRALLDEAITYKCPKDREGKSVLFKKLLQKAEADETEEGHRIVTTSRCLPGSRRRHKRDSVSEHLTHGGSLQNLAQPLASEFDSSFAYLTSGSSQTYGGGRKKNKKYTGPTVSARQREGGSLPSNVNASHSLASLANIDLLFDKKGFYEEQALYDWTNKEKSKLLDKSISSALRKEDKKEKKENKKEFTPIQIEAECERKCSKGKYGTNEMHESENLLSEDKPDYMLINLSDIEVGSTNEKNVKSNLSGVPRPRSLDIEDEGTEMKIIEPRKSVKQITRTSFEIQTPVDTTIEFPIHEHCAKQQNSKITVNGTDVTATLPFQANSVKCVISGTSNTSNATQGKIFPNLCPMMPTTWPSQNITMEGSRYTTQQITMKDSASAGEKKSLDENGNAVQTNNGERKKVVKKKKETNVIEYKAQDVKGHHYEADIDNQINFIENKESKGKKGKTNNPVRMKSSSGTKSRSKDKDSKRENLSSKMKKSNSLEEISKTKLEDLMADKSVCSSGASSISSQQGTTDVSLRRPKSRNAEDTDTEVDCRGDRRSWGTSEGQAIYCNNNKCTGLDYASRRNSNKKNNPELEAEPEFLVVTKKKKSKKQRRSSSGSRAQNLTTSGSYLKHSRGFSNEYRTPISPELRRKSASSMPPSDKSDSSDLDSVHSLPVTSNTSKHNLSKIATSTGGTPQASYADIARMATINMSHSSVLSMSAIVPSILNQSNWPSVPTKSPSEPDKVPHDYYPSLDELQQSDKKMKQFSNSNHIHGLNFNFDKLGSSDLGKIKNDSERTKAEAQEEAINKNIQVFKYVQDIEKMQQNLSQQQANAAVNSTFINSNDNISTNNSKLYNNPIENDSSSFTDNANSKESYGNSKGNNSRQRRNYFHCSQNLPIAVVQMDFEDMPIKKSNFSSQNEGNKKPLSGGSYMAQTAERKNSLPMNTCDDNDSYKNKISNTKVIQVAEDSDANSTKSNKCDKLTNTIKDQHQNNKKKSLEDVNKAVNIKQNKVENQLETQNVKPLNSLPLEKETTSKNVENSFIKKQTVRPAVILLDETSSEFNKSNDLPAELTFGFEINEQLLLSEKSEETSTSSSNYSSAEPLLPEKPRSSYDRTYNVFEKNVRYEKYTSNFHMPPVNTNTNQNPVHQTVVMQPLSYINYSQRYQTSRPYIPSSIPAPPPGIMDKYNSQPKEDFSIRYIAPEEAVNVQNYNHDKIVTFVGSAWDALMKEMPETETGRIQYYSGQ